MEVRRLGSGGLEVSALGLGEDNVGALAVRLDVADLARIGAIMPQGVASAAAWG